MQTRKAAGWLTKKKLTTCRRNSADSKNAPVTLGAESWVGINGAGVKCKNILQ